MVTEEGGMAATSTLVRYEEPAELQAPAVVLFLVG